jgi:hypothetical protein
MIVNPVTGYALPPGLLVQMFMHFFQPVAEH